MVGRLAPEYVDRLLCGVLWAVAALLVRLALNAVIIGNRGSYLFFLLATLCSAAIGGFRSGLFTIVSGVLLAGFSRPPLGSFQLLDPSDPTAIVRLSSPLWWSVTSASY
jgi:hypothetical protein